MQPDFWHRQDPAQPLYPDIVWSRPEHLSQAGKLAVIGGNLHGFAAPAEAYAQAQRAGAGITRVLLPQAVKKLTGGLLPDLEYAPSNPSGSFSQQALAEWLAVASWGDGTLLAGDLGRNSQTAIVFESFLYHHQGQLTITKDAVDYALHVAGKLLTRQQTCLVLSMAQLQKLATAARSQSPITLSMSLVALVTSLHNLTSDYPLALITKYNQHICIAYKGEVSTTTLQTDLPLWRVKMAATAAVWWMQNTSQPFAAFTTAVSQLDS